MNIWTKEIEINAPINHVWKYFDGTLEDMQRLCHKWIRMNL